MIQTSRIRTVRQSSRLRHALGGSLQAYQPMPGSMNWLSAIRMALAEELILNGFHRWRLRQTLFPMTCWSVVEPDATAKVANVRSPLGRALSNAGLEQFRHDPSDESGCIEEIRRQTLATTSTETADANQGKGKE